MKLANYVMGDWVEGKGDGTALVDPTTGEEVARASSDGIDLGAALDYARDIGGPNLRKLSYGERAAALRAAADAMAANRDAYFEIAQANSGNTQIDAMIDVDGGIGTLKFFASIGKGLGDAKTLKDGVLEHLGKDENFRATHVSVPLAGAAIHINAFNFPSWGLWEKAAVSLLSGVPVVAKPASATAHLSYQMVHDVVASGALPDGALTLICGPARDLLDHVTGFDAVAFTGSAETARALRSSQAVIANAPRFNIEADSLNSCVLGPDSGPGSAEFDLFVREVAREMTVKAGQKCTAIRRAFVPAPVLDAVAQALEARLAKTVVGNPRSEGVTMGPIVNKTQQRSVLDGLKALAAETVVVTGGDIDPVDADADTGCFVAPTLMRCDDPAGCHAVHEVEVFGPAATLMPYDAPADAFRLAGLGGGSLVASVFTADDNFASEAAIGLAPSHGRILIIDESVGKSSTGHGIVMPMCVHGGPGRAGGGEELGGLRGLRFYHQRVALQGRADRLEGLTQGAAELTV
ncbi:MAG: 3,4-dehydroadipyl-CoA semialdehyde dehydrogenase [Alphaproteobacteria bacterium]|nr:3,4-dehydroadipyl-CoA semialdehyde dehydrogenase [Alphaproteobacteria bacterium]